MFIGEQQKCYNVLTFLRLIAVYRSSANFGIYKRSEIDNLMRGESMSNSSLVNIVVVVNVVIVGIVVVTRGLLS